MNLPDGSECAVPDRMSLAEFEAFPWPEDRRWELIWGVPVMTPSPQPSHQDLLFQLAKVLDIAVKETGFRMFYGVDVRLPGQTSYLCPDVSVFEADADVSKVPIAAIPRLVVEGLSPSTAANDMGTKRDAYAAAGIPEYWIANPSTNGLSILVEPADGAYRELTVAPDGFIASPTLGKRLRIRHVEYGFEIDVR
ncbi:MAG: Uma2 family endonuclease [Planctomycetes bacterium]|nr:Uma2 family endonuclease [Planctomycetota bacterium]